MTYKVEVRCIEDFEIEADSLDEAVREAEYEFQEMFTSCVDVYEE